ncbi:hypothetical protein GCM10022255_079050 [Dactylosporangium darangshiense]|uniref:DUF3592 domain-containing protein n=1 Tax=Dactylosporangium darangshiense TaxID=579108 RepID=A0ABP8DKP2_9ACTN
MARGSDLGWWGRHPYAYVAITNGLLLLCIVLAVIAGPGAAIIPGFFGLLFVIAAAYSWHWLLKGRHQSKAKNDRLRWKIDKVLLRIGWVVLTAVFLCLAGTSIIGIYGSWRLDRYGVTTEATVADIDGSTITVSFRTGDGLREGDLRTERGDGSRLHVGDPVQILHDPDPGYREVVLAERSPYAGWPFAIGIGAIVAGYFVVVPAGRRVINSQASRHWRKA